MLNFPPGLAVFAIAGVGAAAAPVIIHLLNRRRFRTLHWAPMQFLQQATLRSRKMLELRDVLLMLVRTAALLLFGLVLARPFFSTGYGPMSALALVGGFFGAMCLAAAAALVKRKPRLIALGAGVLLLIAAGAVFLADYLERRSEHTRGQTMGQPVHAILLIDNSMSMAYRQAGRTLLEEAKDRAKSFVDDLPRGSSVTVIPLCGGSGGLMRDPYSSVDDARDAIAAIRIVDQSATVAQAAKLADDAIQGPPKLDKRVILLSDQQLSNWPKDAALLWQRGTGNKASDPDLQIVAIGERAGRENTWVADLRVQDQVADKDLPAVIKAIIRYEGPAKAKEVQVALKVRDDVVNTRTINLMPGQAEHVEFNHLFTSNAKPGEPEFVPISVSVTPSDHLPQDNVRHLAVPVFAALPVLFVDQYGENEDRDDGKYGETIDLRQLLAPKLSRREDTPHLIKIRHMTIDRLAEKGPSALEDVRLVVMAGVADPNPAVRLLREYVEQGGQLFIAAGGKFEPAAWNQTAWEDGAGILPAPLQEEPVGKTWSESTDFGYFHLDFESLVGEYFDLPDEPIEYQRELYGGAYFFKAVVPRLEQADKLVSAETQRISQKLQFLIDSDTLRRRLAQEEPLSEKDKVARQRDKEQRAKIQPRWVTWNRQRLGDPLNRRPGENMPLDKLAKELAELTRPRVMARFAKGQYLTDSFPCLIERSVGLGSIVFLASGTYGDWWTGWNALSRRDSVVLYDRILRSMLERTLPVRNQQIGIPLVMPIDAADRRDRFVINRPGGAPEELAVEVLEGDTYGLILRDITERGTYSVERVADSKEPLVQKVAFNGPAEESDIAVLDEEELTKRMAGANSKWIGKGRKISLQGARVRGEQLWKWLIWSVLLLFVVERIIIAWPNLTTSKEAAA